VALQYTDAAQFRLQGEVPATMTLWQILQFFASASDKLLLIRKAPNGNAMVPHLVIMGQEITDLGTLFSLTLRSMGITRGSCLIRMRHVLSTESFEAIMPSLPKELQPQIPISLSTDAKGVETTQPLVESKHEEPKPEIFAEQREIRVYGPADPSNVRSAPDLPESHYEASEAELRMHFASQQSHTHSILNAPLVSKVKLEERRVRELLAGHPIVPSHLL